jgi:hypothetical protein
MEWAEEDRTKLCLLCEQRGIKDGPDMFYCLALALARERYPASKKPGRPKKWTEWIGGMLVVEIERLVKYKGPRYSVNWACGQLAKREPWKSFLEVNGDTKSHDPVKSLRQAYYSSRDGKTTKLLRLAHERCENAYSAELWQAFVTSFVKESSDDLITTK